MSKRLTGPAALVILGLTLTATPAFAQLRAELVASGFTQPVAFVQDPSDSTVQVVVQQDGRVRVLRNGVVQATDYLDLRSVVRNEGEQGLLGLAFAPNYATSGRVFVNFSNATGETVIARFTRAAGSPLRADPASRFDLLWPGGQRFIDQPFSNHNGGHLVFGPDGFLYIGMGDGGDGNDPNHLAQNPQSLLGKMLRINVNVLASDNEGYDIPANNPFVGQSGVRGEIWSFGLRNPWRYSFDSISRGGTGALVMGDVGQGSWEEIDYEPAGRGGRNYGWRNREGAHNHVTTLPPFSQPLTDPIFEYSHDVGGSVTGGFVYRASGLGSDYRGRYFFADFIRGRVWSIRLTVHPVTGEATASDLREHTAELGSAAVRNPSSFGEDASGELYIVSYAGGIYRLLGTGTPGGSLGGKRRPAGAPSIGRAVPRIQPSAGVTPSVALTRTRAVSAPSDVEPCRLSPAVIAAIQQLLSDDPDRPLVLTIRVTGVDGTEEGTDGLAALQCVLLRIRSG